MNINGDFPFRIAFIDYFGVLVVHEIKYKWSLLKCGHYNMFGHVADQHRKRGRLEGRRKGTRMLLTKMLQNNILLI